MLHILWMIIKFILILIGIILGLLLLVLLLLLFCPVRYQAEGMKEAGSFRTATGRARISWLFGGVSFSLGFTEGLTDVDFRLFECIHPVPYSASFFDFPVHLLWIILHFLPSCFFAHLTFRFWTTKTRHQKSSCDI